jgi:hypothetical protein
MPLFPFDMTVDYTMAVRSGTVFAVVMIDLLHEVSHGIFVV